MKITGIVCSKCDDLIYSRTRHDFRYCSCKGCAIDGGRDYIRIIVSKNIKYKMVHLILPFTKEELYVDYNEEIDLLGLIKSVKLVKKGILRNTIEHTKKTVIANKKIEGNDFLVSLFSEQLKRLEQTYARLSCKSK